MTSRGTSGKKAKMLVHMAGTEVPLGGTAVDTAHKMCSRRTLDSGCEMVVGSMAKEPQSFCRLFHLWVMWTQG